ncbi:GNAT family N-acetyltransferase [Thermomonospora cellulosilytica]|uniref:GNAT superfamily N-acetyltransferase n=1 Tax=Thermomonospora cellulosilytica TaxID=1411118 RepID=A0A7W3MV49_9ACTN|nr:GNAT family N-acetyltransferase [Thermomonospora cellulosilytica]MBA9002454.1 GNAT superfamily N-acetyltransferase [Thermomonospora cellulosilytica]
MDALDLTFTRHDPAGIERILDAVVVPLYEATHADVIDDPFYSAARFAERVRGYVRAPGFEIVVAYLDGTPVGQAFGYALPATSRWWEGLTTPVPDGFTVETGSRTFAFNELMVLPEWQGKGVAHALHDELLGGRKEERATLLVREDNEPAQTAYARWGWKKVGKLRPYPDAPHYDALVIGLPLTRAASRTR